MKTQTLILIGADKGGVGKTMITRALLDYLEDRKIPVRVFDTEPKPGVLKRFYRDSKIANIADVRGQMAIVDGVEAGAVTVVDIRAGGLSISLKALRDAGLLKDVDDGAMQLFVLHVLASTEASLREIAATAELLEQGGRRIVVKNHATDGKFFDWDKATHESFFKNVNADTLISIPHLDAMASEGVDQKATTFSAFAADAGNSRMLRGVVRHWLGQVWKEFDRVAIAQAAA